MGPPFLESLGCDPTRICVTGDDAIEVAWNARPPIIGEALGVNIRQEPYYSGVGGTAVALLVAVIRRFASRYQPRLLPVPISLHGPNDRQGIQVLLGACGSSQEDYPGTLDQVLVNIRASRLLLTGSYHAAVFALSQGVPVVAVANSLHYRQKMVGLAHQFGDKGCHVVGLSEPHPSERIEAAMEELWHVAESLRPTLLACAESQIEAGLRAYSAITTVA